MRDQILGKMLVFCLSILFLISISVIHVEAKGQQEKTIRVGYPIQRGLTMRDGDGNLSGYSYDYLMEISQYTGWNYEFVFLDGSMDEQLKRMMEMLESGQIDIMGAMYYDESLTNAYAYPGYSYGTNYSGIFVPEDSKLRKSSLYNFKNIKVGVHNRKKEKNEILEQYAQMNNIKVEQIVTDSQDEYYKMIQDGKADALLSTDVTMAGHDDMFAVAHFSPKPFYFLTTKGNIDIVRKLDYAISTIDQVNPDYMTQLYNKYFSASSSDVILTEEEKSYIQSLNTLEVVMYDNKPPFQYLDDETGKPAGITVELLDLIAQYLGIKLDYNTVSNYEDYLSFTQNGKADIAADALNTIQDAKNTKSLLTLPWSELPITIMFQKETYYNERTTPAVPYFLKNVVGEMENAVYYDSVEECLQAVQNGDADYCYIGEFCSQYFLYNSEYNDLKKLSNSGIANQKLCFGIINGDLDLLMIFNKGISSIPKETINEVIYRNIYQQQPETFGTYLKQNRELMITVFMALLVILLIITFYIKNRQQKRISFENKRYDAVSNLANEYFYEYNVPKDELVLSEKCAHYFNCGQRLDKFSRRLSELPEEKISGIWQIGQYIISNAEGSIEMSCEMPDHSRQWFKVFSSNIQNKKGQNHAVGKITNIQEVKVEQIRLEQQATIDNLTGIYNIATLKGLIKDCLERLDIACCAFIIMDIDHFKHINDTFGHHKGDAVLTMAAGLISTVFAEDLTGRMGGDEFIIFVQNTTKTEIEEACGLLCKSIRSKTNDMLGKSYSWSIGITWAKKGKSYETLYQEADTALYEIKEKGRNGFGFYEE